MLPINPARNGKNSKEIIKKSRTVYDDIANIAKQQIDALSHSTSDTIADLSKKVSTLPSTLPLEYGAKMSDSILSSIKKYESYINCAITNFQKEINLMVVDPSAKYTLT